MREIREDENVSLLKMMNRRKVLRVLKTKTLYVGVGRVRKKSVSQVNTSGIGGSDGNYG